MLGMSRECWKYMPRFDGKCTSYAITTQDCHTWGLDGSQKNVQRTGKKQVHWEALQSQCTGILTGIALK